MLTRDPSALDEATVDRLGAFRFPMRNGNDTIYVVVTRGALAGHLKVRSVTMHDLFSEISFWEDAAQRIFAQKGARQDGTVLITGEDVN